MINGENICIGLKAEFIYNNELGIINSEESSFHFEFKIKLISMLY